ncbi:MAG: hypothetical protein U9Q17_04190, partial [Chloroflexota bacterium]|nr:hypothetical protein [Chloroflexota bacterium]
MKRKVFVLLVSAAVITSLVLAGCAPEVTPPAAPTEEQAPAEEEEASPAAPAEEVFNWKVQGYVPAGLLFHDFLEHLAASMEMVTDGRIVIDPLPSGTVVDTNKALDAVQSGVLDGVYDYTAMWIGKDKVAPLFCSTPGFFSPRDRMMWEMYGGGKELRQEFYDHIGVTCHAIAAGCTDAEIFMWSNTPLRTIDDFEGKKLRMMPLMGSVLDANGISTVFLPGSEIIPALERGVLDAAEYSVPAFDIKAGYPDVCQYYHFPGIHQPSSMPELVLNRDNWNALPDDLKAKVEYVCRREMMWSWNYSDHMSVLALGEFDKMGREEVIMEPETVATLLEWADEFLDNEAEKDEFFAKVWNSQQDFRDVYYPYAHAMHFSHE